MMQCEGSAKRPRKTKMMQGPRSGREGSAKRKRTRKTKFGPTFYVFRHFYVETALFTSIDYLTVIDRHDQKNAFARHIYFLGAANTTDVGTDAHGSN